MKRKPQITVTVIVVSPVDGRGSTKCLRVRSGTTYGDIQKLPAVQRMIANAERS